MVCSQEFLGFGKQFVNSLARVGTMTEGDPTVKNGRLPGEQIIGVQMLHEAETARLHRLQPSR
jgi:hypothetical protein